MGFSTLIDILGSIIIGGMLFMILLRLNDTAVENNYVYGGELMTQQNLVEIVTLLERDFRKIGFCAEWNVIPDPAHAIVSADSNQITFLTDDDADGNVDTLSYFAGDPNQLQMTENPRDRMLYRVLNSDSLYANLGLTQFDLLYFNSLGDTIPFPITAPGEIHSMEINVTVENTAAYDTVYSSAFWRQIRLAARNLSNR